MSSPLRRWPLLEKMEDTAHPAGMRAPSKPSRSMFLTCLSLPGVSLLGPGLHFPMQSPSLENAERSLPPCISQKKRGNEKNARAPQDTQIPWAQTPLSVWRIIIRTCGFVNGVLQFTVIKLSKRACVLFVPAPFSNPGSSWYDRGNHFAKEGQLCFTPSCGTGTARS